MDQILLPTDGFLRAKICQENMVLMNRPGPKSAAKKAEPSNDTSPRFVGVVGPLPSDVAF